MPQQMGGGGYGGPNFLSLPPHDAFCLSGQRLGSYD
ncbi:hypothetical protein NOVOSPHI9U_370100 [Novosphingobium sp. 9U]|nr:hypothetical protein NOVOSPHI9U_370100 [Novosphingobium sp. 9U]